MRFLRFLTAILCLALVTAVALPRGVTARAATTVEQSADTARQRAEAASGLVDEAVANRDEIERQLADSIEKMNELAEKLSKVGVTVDRLSSQVGYADARLAGIESDIEDQAVNAYMKVVASPTVAVVGSSSMTQLLVAGSMVGDVVAQERDTAGELHAKRNDLVSLQDTYRSQQAEFQDLQDQIDSEIAHFTALYEEADAAVADAIREADAAAQAYRDTLSAIEAARAREAERQRQESRDTTTTSTATTTTPSPTTTSPPDSTTSSTVKTWKHPPAVERWRTLVSQWFPGGRVDEALAIIGCESKGDPEAVNPYSGAAGLFQFLPSTWATTAPLAGFAGYSALDPEANIASAAWLANRYQELGYPYWTAWNCKRVLG